MRSVFSKYGFAFVAATCFVFLGARRVCASSSEPTLELSPQEIGIGSFYHGTSLTLKGTAPADCGVALLLLGEREEQVLKQKGRVGPLWMNVGTVTIRDAPEMYYLLTSSDDLSDLAPSEVLDAHSIGYGALRKEIAIEQEGSDLDVTFREFIKLKESMGLYDISLNSVKPQRTDADSATFKLSVSIPALAPVGQYDVHLYCFSDGQVVSNAAGAFAVEKVGLPQWLSTLAFNNAAIYGILAIVVAVAAGLLMGVLFGSKGKGDH
jgi:uncharacterized protein (TIGR02186 family)